MKTEHMLLHRLYNTHLLAAIPNYFIGAFECDIYTVNKNLYTTEYEIKKTVADFKKDFNKQNNRWIWKDQKRNTTKKHDLIQQGLRTNRFYYVMPEQLKECIEIPNYAGLITFDLQKEWFWINIVKQAPRLHKNKIDEKEILTIVRNFNYRHYSLIFQQMKRSLDHEN